MTCGSELADVDLDVSVEGRVRVRRESAPAVERRLPVGALRDGRASFEVGKGRLVGRDHTGARAGFDGHVADRHAALHREPFDHLARVLDHMADAARHADPPDRPEDDVLRSDPKWELTGEEEAHGCGLPLRESLRREHVLDLRGADAERERAEGTVRRRVAVSTNDRHAGLREAELGSDHVDDALAAASGRVEGNAELGAVPLERVELRLRERIRDRPLLRRHVVVHRRNGQVGPPQLAARQPEAVEGLRRGDLVDEMEVDEEQRGLAGRLRDDVALPDLVEEGLGHRVLPLCRTVGSRPMLKITVGGFELEARLEEEAAPETIAVLRGLLPLESRLVQARWSGEAAWVPMGFELDLGLGPENANSYPAAGELLLYPGVSPRSRSSSRTARPASRARWASSPATISPLSERARSTLWSLDAASCGKAPRTYVSMRSSKVSLDLI